MNKITRIKIKILLLLITSLITLITAHTPTNSKDVIVSYTGHSESSIHDSIPKELININETYKKEETIKKEKASETESFKSDLNLNSDVVFVPNNRRENNEYLEGNNNEKSIDDLIANDGEKSIYDVVNNANSNLRIVEPGNPKNMGEDDIVFVEGRNEEITESNINKKGKAKVSGVKNMDSSVKELDCLNLNCNNTIKSVCGGKIEHKRWKYRSFSNECYFRKVNCGLKYDINRYIKVDNEKCNLIASRNPGKLYFYQSSSPLFHEKNHQTLNGTRRSLMSRRSSTINLNGVLCDHHCPLSCPEDYDPECAISNAGIKKVFINHCMLDYNSCVNNIAWHRQPLSECIGRQQADVRENRAFISWMQRVGIVDANGKLVVS